MKICIISNIFPPYDRGGAEQVVVKTVEGLKKQGHDVVVITGSPKKEEFSDQGNLKIYRIKPRNIFFYTDAHKYSIFLRFFWHIIDIFNFSVSGRVKEILLKEKPDAVHTHNLMGLSFLLPKMIRKLEIRHIHTVHDVQLVEPSGMILKQKENSWRYNGMMTRIYSAIIRNLMGSPQVVISPSQFLLNFYKKRNFFSNSDFKIIRNPATFEIQQTVSSQKSDSAVFNFLYLGQIEYHKGIEFLISVYLELMQESDYDSVLHIIGGGSVLDKIKKISSGSLKIKIYGRKNRSELPDLFRRMDMTVVPSLCYENSPTVIFESFAFGLPVLASNSEGISELIEEGENGVTFQPCDPDSLKKKIKWCIENQEEIKKMKQKTSRSLRGLSQEEYIEKVLLSYQG